MSHDQGGIRERLRSLKVLQNTSDGANFPGFPSKPQDAFKVWLDEAIAAGVQEPHAMTLSTVDENGYPDARVLILKNVDERGWHFASKAGGPKGTQLSNKGYAALTFYWPEQGRQIRIRGRTEPLSEEECRQDFFDRPPGSRVSALASKQSSVLQSRDELLKAVDGARASLEQAPNQAYDGWKVYAVKPDTVEFWQGTKDRLHERLQYVAQNDEEWEKHLLWP